MEKCLETNGLISHNNFPATIEQMITKKRQQILNTNASSGIAAERQLLILNQLAEFDFGRYLLQHQGINGYWTHYMLVHPWQRFDYASK